MPLNKEDWKQLKNVFVEKDDCEQNRAGIKEQIHKNDIYISKIDTKLNISIGILSAIGVAVLSAVVKIFFGG